jgi:hypothetical protein
MVANTTENPTAFHAVGFSRSMIFSDLPSPAEALPAPLRPYEGFAQAGNRHPLFGIML